PVVKGLGLEQVLLLDESRFKRLPSDQSPDPVIGRIAQDSRGTKDGENQADIQISQTGERAGGEQKRIAGQEWRHHEACFTEDDQKQDEVGAGSIVLNHLAQVFVEVEEQIYEVF